jgi:hypothetical protein
MADRFPGIRRDQALEISLGFLMLGMGGWAARVRAKIPSALRPIRP